MPGRSGGAQSFEDGLNQLYQQAGALALANDVTPQGMQFIQLIQKSVLQFRQAMQQEKAQRAAQLGQQAMGMGQPGGGGGGPMGGQMGGPPGAGGPPGGPPGAGQPPQPNQIAPGGGPGMSGYGGVASNPDELQRVLAGTGGVGGAQ